MAILLALTTGCGDPLDRKIPGDSDLWKQDEGFQKAIQELTPEQKELLTGYLMRAGMAEAFGGSVPDITIGDAIENQRKFRDKKAQEAAEEEAEQKRQEELARAAAEERLAKLEEARKALTVAVVSMDFREANFRSGTYQDTFALKIALQNNTDKDMSGVKGSVVFADMFGDTIKSVTLAVDDGIPAGEKILWSGSLSYNQFMDEDKKLRATPLEKLKISWMPEVYLFADGTSMKSGE